MCPLACSMRPARFLARHFTVAIGCCLLLAVGPGQGLPPEAGGAEPTAVSSDPFREGTKLTGREGTFQVTGDRATFETTDGRRFIGLENLNLERIVRTIVDSVEPLRWTVDGTITEYRGSNYLLVSRASVQHNRSRPSSATAAPAPSP